MTWLYWLAMLCELVAVLLVFVAFMDERKAHNKTRAQRDQACSDLDFTTEILSDVATERADLQDQVELLQARLRAQHLQRQAWRSGLSAFGVYSQSANND